MKKIKLICLLLTAAALFSLFCPCVLAENEAVTEPFRVEAKAALLVDLNNDRIIYELHPDERIYPASLTKIMSCLVVLENGNLSDTVTIPESAYNDIDSSSSTAGLMVGEQLTLEQLLYCMMIVSGNEACNTAAEHIAGSVTDFVRMMNERAYELGCEDTHFCNPHGLHDPDHYTTARDLMRITQAALKSETFKQIVNTAEYTLPATNLSEERTLKTTNQLILNSTGNAFYYSRASGIKTGYTSQAGRCVISTAKKDGISLLAIVCGAATTVAESGEVRMESFPQCIRLFQYGFDHFEYVTALSPLYPVTQIRVENSAGSEFVALAPKDEIRVLLPIGYDEKKLVKTITPNPGPVEAPIAAGDCYGTAEVRYEDELIGVTELTAIADVARSEFSAAASETSAYIQQNWWKWIVVFILVLIAAFLLLLILIAIRRRKSRIRQIREHRRNVEQDKAYRDYDWGDEP